MSFELEFTLKILASLVVAHHGNSTANGTPSAFIVVIIALFAIWYR